jgi:hypothetical protein
MRQPDQADDPGVLPQQRFVVHTAPLLKKKTQCKHFGPG